ncbi:MAG: RNA 2',3'-cyclic phosphodiesterase [SAR202 cluster bacterium]|nr:RNA 2',3'-cyclic phosphodiesterase [SAR202 cluster bacterium]
MATEQKSIGSSPGTWRVFIAAELPPNIQQALAVVRQLLPARHSGTIRWLPLDGIHLTLRFLGDVDRDRVASIADRMSAAAAQTGRFQLELAGTGCFPAPERPRVFWVGLRGDLQRLSQLHGRIEGGLSAIGIGVDPRPFHPHLTVGRDATNSRPYEVQAAGYSFARVAVEPGHRFEVSAVTLFRSHLTSDGARYESLRTSALG